MRLIRLTATGLALAFLACVLAPQMATSRAALDLEVTPVRLNADDPDMTRVGSLRWRGGVALSADHADFGGLSGLLVDDDGRRMTAIGDKGSWVEATLTYDETGDLSGVREAVIDGLRDTEGLTVRTADARDAEGLTRLPDGALLVSFEQRHRIWRYPAGEHPLSQAATPVTTPDRLAEAEANKGAEALLQLADGRLLMLVEGLSSDGERRLGYLRTDSQWAELTYPRAADYKPTAAAQLPDGDLLVLERFFSMMTGLWARIRRVPLDRVEAGGRLDGPIIADLRPPLTVDNFEGLDVRRGPDGEVLLYLLSDDNFNAVQRTLLMMFEIKDRS